VKYSAGLLPSDVAVDKEIDEKTGQILPDPDVDEELRARDEMQSVMWMNAGRVPANDGTKSANESK
jgi:hypothetical protein